MFSMIYLMLIILLTGTLEAREYDFNSVQNVVGRLVNSGRHEEALSILKEYESKKMNDCRVYIEMANVYRSMNNPFKAIQVYLEAIEDVPCCRTNLYYKLGMFYYSIGDYEKAVIILNKFMDIVSDSDIKLNYKNVYKVMGISSFIKTNYNNAAKYLIMHSEIDFRDEETYKYLSDIYKKQKDKDHEKAFMDLRNLLINENNISDEDFFYTKGLLFFKYNKYQVAKTNLLKVYEKRRQEHKINFNIGLACFFIGDYKDAVIYLEKAVKYYEKKFSFKKFFNKMFRIDERGAKYLLVLRICYAKNKDNKKKSSTGEKIKEYSRSVYNKYKGEIKSKKMLELYKELQDSWEY